MIPHNNPLVTADDREAVDRVLASGWLAQGSEVEALEASFVKYYGGGSASAVSSGTAALFLALKALGANSKSKVALPTYACSALLNAVYMMGAMPVPVDVLPKTFCLDPNAMTCQASDTDYVVAVHTFGAPAKIAEIRGSTRRVIEDCCHSLGGQGTYGPLGMEGDATIFSFYATKIVTGGQGGMVWAKKSYVAEAVRDYRQFDCRETYLPRFNFQMTDIQAALVNSQMKRLDIIRARRQAIAQTYLNALPYGFAVQDGLGDGRMAYRFVAIAPELAARDAFRLHMERKGILCTVPIERHELLHRYLKLDATNYPVAEHLVDVTLSLPIYPGLSDSQIAHVVNSMKAFKV